MASTVEVARTAQTPQGNTTISNLRPNTRGAGRHRNRGRDRRDNPEQQDLQHVPTQHTRANGSQNRRGGGKANNNSRDLGRTEAQPSNFSNQPAPPLDPPPGPGGGGTFGNRLTKDATSAKGEVLTKDQDGVGNDIEAEICFICASPVVHNSVAPCNHRTCHICALRLRALYKTRACAHCRSEASYVIFTDDPNKRFEDFVDADFQETDDVLGIKYEHKEIYNDTLLLLRYNCPDVGCDIACWGWPDLHRHVKSLHRKILCDLCTRNKKVFTHEHELFTVAELRKHEKFGDDNPGAVDQSGFKGHPECGFCRQRFYGDDELYTHCRDKHEKCHICDRRNYGRQQQYYVDYDSLELHFRKDHFLCADQECLDKKFIVFESEMDLKAHQLQEHPNDLSKDARKDARRVDISSFDYRTPHVEGRGRRDRDGRNSGRGRDPNTEALPQSTAQPLRRDELAYQRQMAIQSAQSISARTFGGQLTSQDAPARHGNRNEEPTTIAAPRSRPSSYPAIDDLQLSPPASPSPQEQARRLQHASVTDRASAMLKNDPSKMSTFRATVSAYRASEFTASQLLDTFFTLFDIPSSELGKLVRELADIYEIDSKREDLLKAWNDWRAINEDYPSLPGPGGGVLPGSSSATTGAGGGYRVLQLKSSTAQSSRSAVSKDRSWGSAADSNPFPTLSISANRAGAGRIGRTPWVAPSASSASSRSNSKPPPASSSSTRSTASDAFPALPATAKPNTLIAGLTKGSVRWEAGRGNGNSAVNPWTGIVGASAKESTKEDRHESEIPAEGEAEGAGKKKSGKGKKQMLYKFG